MLPSLFTFSSSLVFKVFLLCGLTGAFCSGLFGQLIQLETQEWDYSRSQIFAASPFQDSYQQHDSQQSENQSYSMSFNDTYSGRLDGFSITQGAIFLEYEGEYEDAFISEVQSNGDYESMLFIEYKSSWDLFQISSDDSAYMGFESRVDGRIDFSVSEQTLCVLQVSFDGDAFTSSGMDGANLRASVAISNQTESSLLDLELPVELVGNLVASRQFTLQSGDYIGDISLELFYDDSKEGVLFAEGETVATVSLFGRSLSAPELPITLSVVSDEANYLLFSATNLEVGKDYQLIASPDLSFSNSTIEATFNRKVLFPERKVSIGSMGPTQFFRLIELED